MTSQSTVPKCSHPVFRTAIAFLCAASLAPGPRMVFGQAPAEPATIPVTVNEVPKIPNEQLDSLVSPIALYPDPLLIQTLVASTYPLEIIQLEQWMGKNKSLKGQALADAVAKQPWDPSIQGMVAVPDVVTRLAGNIQWTTELGNAFLSQESDVMDAIQRMRAKAQGTGNLQTSTQQVVETRAVEGGKEVIVIEQANPKVVYVPSYDPVVVYGAPVYPYPSYSYPGYVAGAALTLGAGIALGAAWGGSWGYNCGWGRGGGNYVNVNRNNAFVNNASRTTNIAAGNKWQHNPQHRGGAPYGDRGTAGKYGGRTMAQRPGGVGGIGGAGGVGRPGGAGGIGGIGGAGGAGRPGGAGGAGGIGSAGGAGRPGGAGGAGGIGSAGGAGRPGGAGGAGGIGSAGGAGRPGGAGGVSRPSGGSSVGNRSISPGGGSGASRSAFGGGGASGGSVRASSSRGASSMGSARSAGGGGMSRGGGGMSRGGGGGGRGGGGGGRR